MLATEVAAQRLGRSSLVMTVPSIWAKSVGLQKGDPLRVEFLADGSLRVIPLKDNQNGAVTSPGDGSPESDAPAATQEASA